MWWLETASVNSSPNLPRPFPLHPASVRSASHGLWQEMMHRSPPSIQQTYLEHFHFYSEQDMAVKCGFS